MKKIVLGFIFFILSTHACSAQFEKQIAIFKQGCTEAAAGNFTYQAGYCTGTI